MQTDFSTNPLVIDHENMEDLDLVFNAPNLSGPPPTDFNQLVQEHDWARKRVIWVIYGSLNPDSIELLLSKISKNSEIIVAEAAPLDSYHLDTAQRKRLLDIIRNKKLKFVAGSETQKRSEKLAELIDIDSMDAWKPVLSITTMQNHAADVQIFFNRIAELLNKKAMFKTTTITRSVMYLRNALINAPIAYSPDSFGQLKDAMKDRPVLIVSAGPSLNKQLDLLAKNQDLFTILAVNTVWPILHAHGITPDVVLALDPLSKPSWPINGLHQDTLLVTDIGTAPQLVWSNNRNLVITSCNGVIMAVVSAMGGKAGPMSTGGSVATSAFNLGIHLGANPLVFIGQDLAHTNGKDHAEGYSAEGGSAEFKRRYDTGYDVDGYDGTKVRTEHQLLFYKTWFEEQIKKHSDKLVINATEGGAKIVGAVQLSFADVCKEIRSTSLRKKKLPSSGKIRINSDHMKSLCTGIDELIVKVQSFRELAELGMQATQKIGKRTSPNQFRKIDQINQDIQKFDPMTKLVINAFNMADLEKIRYQAHTREGLNKMSDAIVKYQSLYKITVESAGLAIKEMNEIKNMYSKASSMTEMDLKLLNYLTLQ